VQPLIPLIDMLIALIPPTIYYSRVGLELARIIFRGQQMSPPYVIRGQDTCMVSLTAGSTVAQFQSYFQPVVNAARNPRSLMSTASSTANSVNPESVLSSIRNVNGRQLAAVGIVFAEVLGFFTVGEMVGRMKLVGYHGEMHHEH
jgi:F-type H+-transporting ATPase subunit g